MKKSEIINYLQSRNCCVASYTKEGNELVVHVKFLSSSNLVYLENKGLLIFLSANSYEIMMEIIGNIEWD